MTANIPISRLLATENSVQDEEQNFLYPKPMASVDKKAFGRRVAERRNDLGMTQAELASAIGMKQQGIESIESGAVARPRHMRELAAALKSTEDWLLWEKGPAPVWEAGMSEPSQHPASAQSRLAVAQKASPATILAGVPLIPLYSHILAGKPDAVIFDDIDVEMIPAPAQLIGVPNAYAAYVVGESMEKRYRHGEVVYVNPRTPPRRGEDVAVQTYEDDGGQILLLIKRLVSGWPSSVLKLEQLNPHKTIDIPKIRVKAVHRIILGGQR